MLIVGTSVLYRGAVLDVVQFTATCAADITFAWFAPTGITNSMPSGTIANKMPWLTDLTSEAAEPGKNFLTLLQILHIYPWGGRARSGQSFMRC